MSVSFQLKCIHGIDLNIKNKDNCMNLYHFHKYWKYISIDNIYGILIIKNFVFDGIKNTVGEIISACGLSGNNLCYFHA